MGANGVGYIVLADGWYGSGQAQSMAGVNEMKTSDFKPLWNIRQSSRPFLKRPPRVKYSSDFCDTLKYLYPRLGGHQRIFRKFRIVGSAGREIFFSLGGLYGCKMEENTRLGEMVRFPKE